MILPHWFIDAVNELATKVVTHAYGRASDITINVSENLGVKLGLPPGGCCSLCTAAGLVVISAQCEHSLLQRTGEYPDGAHCFYCQKPWRSK